MTIDPNDLVIRTAAILDAAGLPYALYGGLALAAYGVPRETHDADHLVPSSDLDRAEAALLQAIEGAIVPFRRRRFGGVEITRVTLLPQIDGPPNFGVVDLVAPVDGAYAARALARRGQGTLRGNQVSLLSPEDFIVLKILSGRPRDLADVESVLSDPTIGPRLDRGLVAREVAVLAVSLTIPDLVARWETVHFDTPPK